MVAVPIVAGRSEVVTIMVMAITMLRAVVMPPVVLVACPGRHRGRLDLRISLGGNCGRQRCRVLAAQPVGVGDNR